MRLTGARILNAANSFQNFDKFKRTLCVCSAGLLRSPTLAWVLSNSPYNRNTRACGSHPEFALVPFDEVLFAWADEIVFVNKANHVHVVKTFELSHSQVYVLDVADQFGYREPELIKSIERGLKSVGFPIYSS